VSRVLFLGRNGRITETIIEKTINDRMHDLGYIEAKFQENKKIEFTLA